MGRPPSSSSSSLVPSTTDQSSQTLTSTTAQTAKSTFTQESITTGADGAASTVYVKTTAFSSPTDLGANQSHSDSHSGSNIGLIVGLALGVPLILILAGILIFCVCRRRRISKTYSSVARPSSPPIEANYSNIVVGSHAPELDSYPVAPTRTKSNRKSELYGSESHVNSPNPSFVSVPPQYSPGAKTPTMTQIQEEPQELWGVYVPYRPPRADLPSQNGNDGS